MISDFLGGTSQDEVMGVVIANDHALRIAQGVPPMIQSFRLQSYSSCIIIAHSHLETFAVNSILTIARRPEMNATGVDSGFEIVFPMA